MPNAIQLQIPDPCHENWDGMTPEEKGRFCGSCQKIVVDFSVMTDKEILDYFSKASQPVCGRFSNDQLNKDISVTEKKKRFSFAYLWNVLLATLLLTETNAQVKPKSKKPVITNIPTRPTMGTVAYVDDVPVTAVIPGKLKGTVLDAESRHPVIGASIGIKGVKGGISTDEQGHFKLPLHKKEPVVFEISAVGYETQTYIIDKNTNRQNLNIFLKPVSVTLPEVIVVSYGRTKGRVVVAHYSMPQTVAIERDSAVIDSVGGKITCTSKVSIGEKIIRAFNNMIPPYPKKEVKVFPNPVVRSNEITVKLALKQPGIYKMELLNAAGQVLMVQPLIMQTRELTATMPVQPHLSSGIYWIRISAEGIKDVYQAKLLVQ